MSDVNRLVIEEPWRLGVGQPLNALDPTWKIERSVWCTGRISYDGTGTWWFCMECGYCGSHRFHQHRPIHSPLNYLMTSVDDYVERRQAEGVDRDTARRQMMQLAGMSIRYAATRRVGDLKEYLEQLVIK